MNELKERLDRLKGELENIWQKINIEDDQALANKLEEEVVQPEIWKNPELAKQKNVKLAKIRDKIQPWLILKLQVQDLNEILELKDADLMQEVQVQLEAMENEFEELKKVLRFNGDYDQNDVILRVTAGVGGTEAMDWAGMLERMYLRFCEQQGFEVINLERLAGEEAGVKTAVYEIRGVNAYGNLKSEHGVHRLVRLSPFNADNLRQTSFALVEILPVLETDDDLEIDSKDLRIDVYRAGGHGGQSVNTTDSAVRITHLPTGTVVAIQNERSQLQNREKAMEILRGKLVQMKQEQKAESFDGLRAGESAKWGQQIRNYVLQPYKLVKDTRTKYEETDVEAVLDGEIDGFIDAYLEMLIGSIDT